MTTLQRAKRQATIDILLTATHRGLVARGLDLTLQDVADAAGVSRSTVLRHFGSRDELIVAAIKHILAAFEASLPTLEGADWRTWLRQLCERTHGVGVEMSRCVWDLTGRTDLSPRLGMAVEELESLRRERYELIAAALWHARGGQGGVAPCLRYAVATHLSPLFTITVLTDVTNADGQLAANLAESCITAALEQQFPAVA